MATLCEQYGFDADGIERRLSLVGLAAKDHEHAAMFRKKVIKPHVDEIVEAFYRKLLAHPDTAAILSSGFDIDGLKKTQRDYLLSLGLNFDTKEYFEHRLRVGCAHARANVPLSVYQCSYGHLQTLLFSHFSPSLAVAEQYRSQLRDYVLRITTLDMSLAIHTYYTTRVEKLEHTLDVMLHEEFELRHSAETDALTGVANRKHIIDLLGKTVRISKSDHVPLSVAMLDIDHFKEINDTHGHLVGDQVLRDVAARTRAGLRDFDTLGRYGGEEFLMILLNTSRPQALEIAERVRHRVAETPVHAHGHRIPVTVSIGLAFMNAVDEPAALIERADVALYRAKDAGRNRVVPA